MTLFDLHDLSAYWRSCPPTHVLVAAYLGALKEDRKSPPTRNEVERFAQALGLQVRHHG